MKYENLKKELVDLIHESTYGTFWITNYYKDARQGLGIILLFIVIFFTNMTMNSTILDNVENKFLFEIDYKKEWTQFLLNDNCN